jgi:radical SAM superfamily enzyme YgiQ (UPF0313 family)
MRVLLVSTYDLGRQPFGLASPAAWLERAGAEVVCADTSRDVLGDEEIAAADLIAFFLPMHTATRLAMPLIARARTVNPRAQLAAYGLYAPLNADWLRARGVRHVIGPEAEGDLTSLVEQIRTSSLQPAGSGGDDLTSRHGAVPRLRFVQPDRTRLPPLSRYAALQMPDGSRKVVGSTESTRGCKHLCRHCPIVPVYRGAFRVVPIDVVLQDVAAQVAAGASHITFGDPDFFNGPGHARQLMERFAVQFPGVTYDVTIKIEHLLKHADLLPVLRGSGCLFITSAVESVDDAVLGKLRKGHTRADFGRAVELCRHAGVTLSPTFVPFTPWTTIEGYADLLGEIGALGLTEAVAPVQLGIRLLVTAESALLELPDVRGIVDAFDAESLVWPWRHEDRRVDALQVDVMRLVGTMAGASRSAIFEAIVDLLARTGGPEVPGAPAAADATKVPYLTEGWYCCAEPGPEQIETV